MTAPLSAEQVNLEFAQRLRLINGPDLNLPGYVVDDLERAAALIDALTADLSRLQGARDEQRRRDFEAGMCSEFIIGKGWYVNREHLEHPDVKAALAAYLHSEATR